jgi:cytochrome c oxidase assembly factor CtaG
MVNTVLSSTLAFCGRPVYTYYLDHPNPFLVSPLDDQVLGAVIMWVIGSLVILVPAMPIALELAGGRAAKE